jgi:rod shape-determining protein MreD
MLLRVLLIGVSLAVAAVIDGAWLWRLPLPAAPDLLLLIALAVGLRHGLASGAAAGAAAGYLRDLISGGPLGLFALSYLAVGALAGAASAVVDLQERSVPAAAALVGTFALALFGGALISVTGVAAITWVRLVGETVVAAALNALLAGWVDALIRSIDRLAQRRYEGRVIGHKVLR